MSMNWQCCKCGSDYYLVTGQRDVRIIQSTPCVKGGRHDLRRTEVDA